MKKKSSIADFLSICLVSAFRVFACVAFFLVLIFPAFKGVAMGYLPVATGLLFSVLLVTARERVASFLSRISPQRYYVLLLGVPIALQVAMLMVMRPEPVLDARFVFAEAVSLVETGAMNPNTYYAPGQTWWYALFIRLFGTDPLVAQLSLIPLFAGIVWLVYRLSVGLMGESWGRFAGLLIAYYPTLLCSVLITPYYLYLYTLLVLSVSILLLLAARSRESCAVAFLGGLCAGFGALTKAVLLMAPVQAVVFWALAGRADGTRYLWRRFIMFIFGMALLVGPWALRNYKVFDEVVLVNTSGGLVLLSANNPDSNGLYSSLPDDVEISTPQAFWEHSKACATQAKIFIREHPMEFVRLAGYKLLHTWGNETTFAELINMRGRTPLWLDQLFSFGFLAGWSALVGLWSLAAIRGWRDRRVTVLELLVATMVLSNAAVYIVYEGGARHHVPLVPLLVIYALFVLREQNAAPSGSGSGEPSAR